MAQALSDDLRRRVAAAVEGGRSRRGAAKRYGIAPSTAIKWVDAWQRTGSYRPGRQGDDRRSRRAAAQPHPQAPRGLGQRHVLDQKPRHSLALALWRGRIVPQTGDVAGQCEDSPALLFVQLLARLGVAALELAWCLLERPKLRVPLRLQHVGHRPLAPGLAHRRCIRRAPGAAQPSGLGQSGRDRRLYGWRQTHPRLLHGFHPLKAQRSRSIPNVQPVHPPLPIAQPRLITLIREGGPPRRLTTSALIPRPERTLTVKGGQEMPGTLSKTIPRTFRNVFWKKLPGNRNAANMLC